LHLYVHIPFCHRICPYCSFYKHTPGETPVAEFIEALVAEAGRRTPGLAPIQTVYFGGGTPSMLSPTHLRRLVNGLRETLGIPDASHLTLEANPATFGKRTAAVFRELGISRISLGAQSFHPAHLQTLGREHGPADIAESVLLLREAGIPEINVDLIFSVPGQNLDDWEQTIDAALALDPDHLSAYNLTYEEDTDFFRRFQSGRYRDNPAMNAEMFALAEGKLVAAGFRHYETSNYARPGHESAHNQAYWSGADYLGLGPSAVSTIDGRRWKNMPDTARYMAMIQSLGHAEAETETIGPEEYRVERIALLLRTDEGVPLRFLDTVRPGQIDQVIEEGLAERSASHLRLIGRGPLLVDSITEHLVC